MRWLNWIFSVLFFVLFTSVCPLGKNGVTIKKWGFYGHKKINRMAVFTLPPELFTFYKSHIEFLTQHAVDPDKRRYAVDGEASKHYIDIDFYVKKGENLFDVMPKKWGDAVNKFTKDTLMIYGILPWNIERMSKKLRTAFKSKNFDLILKYSAEIGHYIGDAHVPLHTTENYNGQFTNQKGIHGFWESRLPEINANGYDYFLGKAKFQKNILGSIWDAIQSSYNGLDSVLLFEKQLSKEFSDDKKYSYEQRGQQTVRVYSYEFSQAYHKMLNGMVERRMQKSIICIGSIWYTEWVNAGKPNLNSIKKQEISDSLNQEFQKLDNFYFSKKIRGRNHQE